MIPFCGFGIGIERSTTTSHNIQQGIVRGVVSRSAGAPTTSESTPRGHNNSIPKPWHVRAPGQFHVNTPQPLKLQASRLLGREHGVVAVSVVGEDRVVAPQHASMIGQGSKP